MATSRLVDTRASSYGATSHRSNGSFEDLHQQISSLVMKINTNATSLERQARRIGTKDDGPQLQDKLHSMQRETNAVAADVTNMMRDLQELCARNDRQKKLQVERLKTSFKTNLERYNGIQKNVMEQVKSQTLLRSNQQTQNFSEEPDTWSDEAALVEQNRRREQLMQQQIEAEDELAFARDREERIRELESDVLDINDMFKQLGVMVKEQGEIVDDIESNVGVAADNVDAGNVQLNKAVSYQKSYRKKLCILVVILVVVAGVIALILGLSLSKH